MTPPFSLFHRTRPRIPAQRQPVERSRSKAEAARSIEEQRAKLEDIKAQTPRIVALGKSLRELHEHNHIAESLIHIIGGHP
jgi:hypothetical protein